MAAQAPFPGAVFAFGCRLTACAKNAAHGRSAQTEGLVRQQDALLRAHTRAPCTLPLPPQHNNTAHRATAACPPSCGTDTHQPTLIIKVSAPRGDLPWPDVPSPAGQAGWGHNELESHVPASSVGAHVPSLVGEGHAARLGSCRTSPLRAMPPFTLQLERLVMSHRQISEAVACESQFRKPWAEREKNCLQTCCLGL